MAYVFGGASPLYLARTTSPPYPGADVTCNRIVPTGCHAREERFGRCLLSVRHVQQRPATTHPLRVVYNRPHTNTLPALSTWLISLFDKPLFTSTRSTPTGGPGVQSAGPGVEPDSLSLSSWSYFPRMGATLVKWAEWGGARVAETHTAFLGTDQEPLETRSGHNRENNLLIASYHPGTSIRRSISTHQLGNPHGVLGTRFVEGNRCIM
ncbi:hypothetical protein Bbelb_128720 [Branchiostoma belcheri]|nr:hypothetical protein Bbelb_128720 [Branchiostoma belcheri]